MGSSHGQGQPVLSEEGSGGVIYSYLQLYASKEWLSTILRLEGVVIYGYLRSKRRVSPRSNRGNEMADTSHYR